MPPASAVWPPLHPIGIHASKDPTQHQQRNGHLVPAPEALDDRPVPESGQEALRPLPAEVRALLGITIPDELLARALGDAIEHQIKVQKPSGDAEQVVVVRVRALRVRRIAKRLMFVTVAPLCKERRDGNHVDDTVEPEQQPNAHESSQVDGEDNVQANVADSEGVREGEYEVQLIAGRSLIAEMGADAAAAVLANIR
jgi:hypothetical protein